MQVVSFPPRLIRQLTDGIGQLMESGSVAEGKYFGGCPQSYVRGQHSLPVTSGGAGVFALLAFQKHHHGKTRAIVQSNTMRALYTVPSLLGMRVSVAESSYQAGMAMDPAALQRLFEAEPALRESAVVVYSVIAGFLPPAAFEVARFCESEGVPLIVDAAHAHYLDSFTALGYPDWSYSFYATKILPSGEGGLVSTSRSDTYDWVKRFLMYDRFNNELAVGLNLRASEITSYVIHTLMTDASLREYFRDTRVAIGRKFSDECKRNALDFVDPDAMDDYNGYKFVVLSPYEEVARLDSALTRFPRTSGVFDTDVLGRPTSLPHWCPPTYASLAEMLLD